MVYIVQNQDFYLPKRRKPINSCSVDGSVLLASNLADERTRPRSCHNKADLAPYGIQYFIR